jgi:hypothetical protein
MPLTAEIQFVAQFLASARPAVMLRVVAPYVAEMLHLKWLTINVVTGVAGFQTMSTCKLNINSLAINVLVLIFTGFLRPTPFTPTAEFRTPHWADAILGTDVPEPN